jgi:hypothetical protein
VQNLAITPSAQYTVNPTNNPEKTEDVPHLPLIFSGSGGYVNQAIALKCAAKIVLTAVLV